MTAKPASETVRSSAWIGTLVVLLGAVGFMYFGLLRYSYGKWLEPDYSHGFLVPLFAAFLAYHWRAWAPDEIRWPDARGLGFVAGGAAVFLIAGFTNIAKEWLQGASLVLVLCGITHLMGGLASLRWLWPALAFLLFMFPLPYKVETAVNWPLQKAAAVGAEFALQTLGYPTYRDGNIIHAKDHVLEVEKACSGLSMLLTFLALSTAVALVVKRPWVDRAIILLSAVPIAILSNVVRIALTGVLYNEAGKELGDRVFHDFAGWLMMPFALVLMVLELKILDWVLLEDLGQASREDIIRMGANPTYLVMSNFEPPAATGPKLGAKPTVATPPAGASPPGAGR